MNYPRFASALSLLTASLFLCFAAPSLGAEKDEKSSEQTADQGQISYHNDVRPILMSRCAGCHKPGKAKGELDLTTHTALMKGGTSGKVVAPGEPAGSLLYFLITGENPEMPKDGEPLEEKQIATIEKWIAQGAQNDTPDVVKELTPPAYHAAPAITTLAFSPDGQLLAVAGYREVVLHKADGSQIVARLVGPSPRIESLAFSPDGKRLAVAGGAQTQYGEIQLWNLAERKQIKRLRIGYDTLFGLSFHPDGQSVAVGSTDNAARWIDLDSGQTKLRFAPHGGWVLGTGFDQAGKTLLSASQDHTVKMAELKTGKYAGMIRSAEITSFAVHPKKDWIACGARNGQVRLYDLAKGLGTLKKRRGTETLQVIKQQPGPVTAVAFGPNGQRIAVGSPGEVRLYQTENGKQIAKLSPHEGPVYAVAFHPDGKIVASGGFDGKVRLFDPSDGKLKNAFPPVPLRGERLTDGPSRRRN